MKQLLAMENKNKFIKSKDKPSKIYFENHAIELYADRTEAQLKAINSVTVFSNRTERQQFWYFYPLILVKPPKIDIPCEYGWFMIE